MDLRVGILILFVLGASWSCNARQLVVSDDTSEINLVNFDKPDLKMNHKEQKLEVEAVIIDGKSENVCMLCEQFTSQALIYLSDNNTRTQILAALHQSCSQLRSFRQECGIMVDYYVPLFFLEMSMIQPGHFCQSVNLCQQMTTTPSPVNPDSCGFCHHAVEEILVKLKDPDTQLEILEILLKACNAADTYAKKCKRLVFEYGPLIITNGEKFLETTDICATLHACNTSTAYIQKDLPLVMLSDS